MSDKSSYINYLFTAELQFRLASAVQCALVMKKQPLDLPQIWTHGQHKFTYDEIALRKDQAVYASFFMHRSATYLMAAAIREAIIAVVDNPKDSSDSNVQSAYQISRMIRNAFTHKVFKPTWSIDEDCRDKTFSVKDIISFDTTNLHEKPFDWRHYGGPLALLRLCRYVRFEILGDEDKQRDNIPDYGKSIYQQGNLIIWESDFKEPS